MIPKNGFLATKFLENGYSSSGTMTRSQRVKSPRAKAISKIENTIEGIAQSKGIPVDAVITNLLAKSVQSLVLYVTGCGEIPKNNLLDLAYQVALLRLQDISTTAQKLDTDDYDAQCQIENAEDDLIQSNNPQAKWLLPEDVQACINIICEHICENFEQAGGDPSSTGVLMTIGNTYENYLDEAVQDETIYGGGPDIGGGGPVSISPYNTDFETDPTYSPINPDSGLGSGGIAIDPSKTLGGGLMVAPDPSNVIAPTGGGSSSSGSSSGSSLGGILSGIGNALGGLLGGALDGVAASAQGTVSNLATQSFKDAIIKNLPLIIGIVIGLTLIILGIVYVAKRSTSK